MAEWARTPIELGPGCCFTPLVIGPDQLPAIVDPDAARGSPELAVLSAMAHGRSRDTAQAVQIALAALTGCVDLDAKRATLYADVVRVSLGKAARNALEALMRSPDFLPFQSDFARKYTAIGEAKGRAEALLRVLARRGVAISQAQRERVLACTEPAEFEVWLDRAVTANSAEDVFG